MLDDAPQLTAALHALAHDPSQRDATLELLHASLNSKTLRDVEPDASVYEQEKPTEVTVVGQTEAAATAQ